MTDKKYLLFATVPLAQAFLDDLNAQMGANYSGMKVLADSSAACIVCPMCYEHMTGDQIAALVTVRHANLNYWPDPDLES